MTLLIFLLVVCALSALAAWAMVLVSSRAPECQCETCREARRAWGRP